MIGGWKSFSCVFGLILLPVLACAQEMRNETVQMLPIIGLFKMYSIDEGTEWIGPFASGLIGRVKEDSASLEKAKEVRAAAFFKMGGIALTPVFLFTGINLANQDFERQKSRGVKDPDMPTGAAILVGLGFASFLTFVIGDIAENTLLTTTAETWNSKHPMNLNFNIDRKIRSVAVSMAF